MVVHTHSIHVYVELVLAVMVVDDSSSPPKVPIEDVEELLIQVHTRYSQVNGSFAGLIDAVVVVVRLLATVPPNVGIPPVEPLSTNSFSIHPPSLSDPLSRIDWTKIPSEGYSATIHVTPEYPASFVH